MRIAQRLLMCAMALALLSACDPFAEKRAKGAEEKRIECSDKFCDGDVYPSRNSAKDALLKLNGQWYAGPKEYFSSGINGASFIWWDRKPVSSFSPLPAEVHALNAAGKGNDVSIAVFFTGRQRWPNPGIAKPWEGKGWEARFDELQKQGWRITRQQLNPDLEHVRFSDVQGKAWRDEYFLASKQQRVRGEGPPGISCSHFNGPKFSGTCTGGAFWQEDVYADFRFSAKHAQDWPAIHQEILRVLQLIKKV